MILLTLLHKVLYDYAQIMLYVAYHLEIKLIIIIIIIGILIIYDKLNWQRV